MSSPKESPSGTHRVPWSVIPNTDEPIILFDENWNKVVVGIIDYEEHEKIDINLEDDAYDELEQIAERYGVSVNDAVVWLLRNCP